jgi:hypothetical protein
MTTKPPLRLTLLPLFALLLVFAPALAGDKEVADLLCEKGDKASRARKYEEAVAHYERALEEHSAHPAAAFGLGKALEKLGRTGEALSAYLRCLDALKARKSLNRAQKRMKGLAEKAVKKLAKGYAELAKLDEKFVAGCMAFGKKNFNGAPSWSKKAFDTALLIDPGNKLAVSYAERLRGVRPPSVIAGLFKPMIESDKLERWTPGLEAPWKCSAGVLSANATGTIKNLMKVRLKGSYSLRASFRFVGNPGHEYCYGLMFGTRIKVAWGLLVTWEETVELVRFIPGGAKRIQTRVLTDFKPGDWVTVRATVEEGDVTAYVNGKSLFTYQDAEEEDTYDGGAGVLIQRCSAEIRDVEMKR